MTQVYNSPPNWPLPPPNWQPPPDWQPDPAWGPAPYGWQFWSGDSAPTAPQYVPGQPLTRTTSAQLEAGTTGRPPPALLVFAAKLTIGVVGGALISWISGAHTLTRWLIATGLIWTGFLIRGAIRWRA